MSSFGQGASVGYRYEVGRLPAGTWTVEPLVHWLGRVFDPDRDPQAGGVRTVQTENGLYAVHAQVAETGRIDRLVIVGQVAIAREVAPNLFDVDMHFGLDDEDTHPCTYNACRAYRADTAVETLAERDVAWPPRTFPLNRFTRTHRALRGDIAGAVREVVTDAPYYDVTIGEQAYQLFERMAPHHGIDAGLVEAVRQARAA